MPPISNVQRPQYHLIGSEAEVLSAMLDHYRGTLLWKCEGLDEAQLRRRSVTPSALCLLDLLRHMTEAERYWFQHCLAGRDIENLYVISSTGYVDESDKTPAAEVARNFLAACEESRRIFAAVPLDEVVPSAVYSGPVCHRFIVTHLIGEYARHCGHADLLREAIDGAVGE